MSVIIGGKEADFWLQNCASYLTMYILIFGISISPTTGDL